MAKSEAQIRANKKHRQTTQKLKYTKITLLRSTHAIMKNISLRTGENMQEVILNAMNVFKVKQYDK
jgi:hypothetical protein